MTLAHAPLGKYKAYKKGVYGTKTATLKEIESFGSLQGVRLGTYGDPCAVPNDMWQALTSKALYSTAYTHAAINPMPESIMTSTDNLKQSIDAWVVMKGRLESYLMLINYIRGAKYYAQLVKKWASVPRVLVVSYAVVLVSMLNQSPLWHMEQVNVKQKRWYNNEV